MSELWYVRSEMPKTRYPRPAWNIDRNTLSNPIRQLR